MVPAHIYLSPVSIDMPQFPNRYALTLLLLSGVLLAGCVIETDGSTETRVVQVIDGDTVVTADGATVRLLDINTPEDGQPYHDAATQRLRELVANRTVRLERGDQNIGQHGRLLRYVHVNGTLVNAALVREGLATTYYVEDAGKYRQQLTEAEQAAREQGRGMWSPSPAADCVTVMRFQWDPQGNDNDRLNEEFVTFRNACSSAVQMTDWTVTDAGTSRYTFPDRTLQPGQTVTLHTGSGTATATDLYWGRTSRAVWNNDGDALHLRDADGGLVLYRAYQGEQS